MMNHLGACVALCCAAIGTTAGEIVHWAVPAMSDVQRLPDMEPKDGVKGGVVRIVAAKGEYEPGSFVVRAAEDLGKVKFEVSDLRQVKKTGEGEEKETGVVFPKENVDLKFVKVWYQNRNAWFSYFGDTGFKLCPELLVNDEDLIRVDTAKKANYARLVEADGTRHERWLNPPRQLDQGWCEAWPWYNDSSFQPMKPNFRDADTLQPVALEKGVCKQFFLTVHVTKDIPAGLYRGEVKVTSGTRGMGQLVSIPVEIRVLDYELPAPKGYHKPDLDFRVASYNYLGLDIIMAYNGGDTALAVKQYEALMRDQAAHNQLLSMARVGSPFCYEFRLQFDAQKRAGMCTDPYFAGAVIPYDVMNNLAACATNAVMQQKRLDREYGHHNVYVTFGDEPSSEWQRKTRPVFEVYQRYGYKFCIAGNEQTYNPNGYLWDWFNCAAEPTDDHLVKLWSDTLDIPVAWYAQHHVGTENPAFQRRQNGMGAWLTGYTALDNYAHHLGSWNDDRTTYKPMVYAYGTYGGPIDTLAWEGFREGVDDIRYGTLMCRLAREAQKRGDIEAKKAGGKALQYLALFDKTSGDLNTCRAEMIRHIESLRAVLAAKPIPVPEIEVKLDEPVPGGEVARLMAKAERLYAEGKGEEAVRMLTEGYFKSNGAFLARDLLERFLLKHLDEPDCPTGFRRAAYLRLRERHPGAAAKCEKAWLGADDEKAKARRMESLLGLVSWHNDWYMNGYHRTVTWALTKAAELSRELKKPLKLDARGTKHVLMDYADQRDFRGLAYFADTVFASNTFSQAHTYALHLAAELLPETYATPEVAAAKVKELDAKHRGELTDKQRVDMICLVGSAASACVNENLVRGMDVFRKALYRPVEKKSYVVRFSDRALVGDEAWAKVPKTPLDREFGGSMEFLATDVTTGNRGEVATGAKKQKAAPPEMQVAADADGLHFRFTIPEPKAQEIALRLANAGSFEAYLGPGENTPYVCFLLTPGSDEVGTFNTMYDTEGHRMLKKNDATKAKWGTVFRDDRLVCQLDLRWELYPAHLPKDGDVWEFEAARWGSAGGQCWNGMESIHGRSTWGRLAFELTDAQARTIVKRQCFAAWAQYKRENTAWRYEGCLKHWEDTEVGDPAFHAAVIKPLMEDLEPYGKLMKADISDVDLQTVYEKAYPTWVDIVHIVARLRAEYLNR